MTKIQSDNEKTQSKLSEIQKEVVRNGDVMRKHKEETELRFQQLAGNLSNITHSVEFNHERIKTNETNIDVQRGEVRKIQKEMQKYENRMVEMQAEINHAMKELSNLRELIKRN